MEQKLTHSSLPMSCARSLQIFCLDFHFVENTCQIEAHLLLQSFSIQSNGSYFSTLFETLIYLIRDLYHQSILTLFQFRETKGSNAG